MITFEECKEHISYDPWTGELQFIKGARKGRTISSRHSDGSIRVQIKGRRYRAHHIAWLLVFKELPENEIDHINGVNSDNRLINLRCVTHQENMRNAKLNKKSTSGVCGVRWHKKTKKWHSHIRVDGLQIHLGSFPSFIDAVSSRNKAEADHGFHHNHGRI